VLFSGRLIIDAKIPVQCIFCLFHLLKYLNSHVFNYNLALKFLAIFSSTRACVDVIPRCYKHLSLITCHTLQYKNAIQGMYAVQYNVLLTIFTCFTIIQENNTSWTCTGMITTSCQQTQVATSTVINSTRVFHYSINKILHFQWMYVVLHIYFSNYF
jgi:hypothetical protein